jgi:hypothetical protein
LIPRTEGVSFEISDITLLEAHSIKSIDLTDWTGARNHFVAIAPPQGSKCSGSSDEFRRWRRRLAGLLGLLAVIHSRSRRIPQRYGSIDRGHWNRERLEAPTDRDDRRGAHADRVVSQPLYPGNRSSNGPLMAQMGINYAKPVAYMRDHLARM